MNEDNQLLMQNPQPLLEPSIQQANLIPVSFFMTDAC